MRKSAHLVLQILSDSEFLTQEQLIKKTGLSERTIKYAVRALIYKNIISEQQSFADMRRKIYRIRGEKI